MPPRPPFLREHSRGHTFRPERSISTLAAENGSPRRVPSCFGPYKGGSLAAPGTCDGKSADMGEQQLDLCPIRAHTPSTSLARSPSLNLLSQSVKTATTPITSSTNTNSTITSNQSPAMSAVPNNDDHDEITTLAQNQQGAGEISLDGKDPTKGADVTQQGEMGVLVQVPKTPKKQVLGDLTDSDESLTVTDDESDDKSSRLGSFTGSLSGSVKRSLSKLYSPRKPVCKPQKEKVVFNSTNNVADLNGSQIRSIFSATERTPTRKATSVETRGLLFDEEEEEGQKHPSTDFSRGLVASENLKVHSDQKYRKSTDSSDTGSDPFICKFYPRLCLTSSFAY
jgi:hypothetical protein